ncbi:MAG: polysaccharide deacetylase family protein [Coriobacteriia bacterium]|nr:polysaccharide deacetylase family protein [Coriobacteriia bacterium]
MLIRPIAILTVAACLVATVTLGCARSQPTAQKQPLPSTSVEPTVSPIPEPTKTPEPAPEPAPQPAPVPAPVPTPPVTPAPTDNKTRAWYFMPVTTHKVPAVASEAATLLPAYGGIYVGPNAQSVYLTFDEGYENGLTPKILDALARNNVKATFFVTESFIRANPDLVRRMVAEGHVVGNHSSTHPSMPTLAGDTAAFKAQFTKTEAAFTEVTGGQMANVFRPPMGEYSPLSLWITQSLGYETVFWSFAHRDWVVDDQPSVDVTVDRILTGSHPGAIYLLHGVSSSDTAALDRAIAGLRTQGYGFGVLGE